MPIEIRELRPDDYPQALALCQAAAATAPSAASPTELMAMIRRHPGLSVVAQEAGRIVGALFCGRDGDRGCLNHLALDPTHQHPGLAKLLIDKALVKLRSRGIHKCHLRLPVSLDAPAFWNTLRWSAQADSSPLSPGSSPLPLGEGGDVLIAG